MAHPNDHFVRGFTADIDAEFTDGEPVGAVSVLLYRFQTEGDASGNFDNEAFWGVMELEDEPSDATALRLNGGDPVRLISRPSDPHGLPVESLAVVPVFPGRGGRVLVWEADDDQ